MDDSYYRKARAELDDAVVKGLMEISGHHDNGDPIYRLTPAGKNALTDTEREVAARLIDRPEGTP